MAEFKLYNYQQAHQTILDLMPRIKARLQAGNVLTLTITEPKKSREQEEKYHAMIGDISRQAEHMGSRWDAESWKRFLVDQFVRDLGISQGKIVPSLDKTGIVQLGMQTRSFTTEQATEFIEWLHSWGADNGITFKEHS